MQPFPSSLQNYLYCYISYFLKTPYKNVPKKKKNLFFGQSALENSIFAVFYCLKILRGVEC